jgi:hypothetical protein
MSKTVRITHRPTGTVLAEGPLGWGITPFEGNYYIARRYRKDGAFRPNFIPSICVYKFLYVWMDLCLPGGEPGKEVTDRSIAWMYWLPNPLFPFIWFRVALPAAHPHLLIERF